MKSKPSENSSLETECLFGETVEVLDDKLDWVYCRLVTDNYNGWIKKSNIGKFIKATHRVLNIRTFIYKRADVKSDIAIHLPMGANLAVEKINSGWAEIYFPINNIIHAGYVPAQHIVELRHKVSDWVAVAQSFEGIPYKWGGRDSAGIDCSALLQLSYQTYGQSIPRNTSDQITLKKSNVNQIHDLKRGCVIFWEGHVGIMIDKENCIHANAFHMKTVTEPLDEIINRTLKDHHIIKMMDFN
jgi:cell wall-associated NlpC family hydrolase